MSNNSKHIVEKRLKKKKKKKRKREIEFSPVYFNSTTKTVTNRKFDLDKSFQEILYRLIIGLMKHLGGLLNQLIHNTLTFQLIDC